MKYCCKKFKEVHDDLCGGSPFKHGVSDVEMLYEQKENQWYIMCKINMDSSGCEYELIYYCPFCGERLR